MRYARVVKAREVVKTLTKQGASLVRQNGSHARYVSPCGRCATTVPMHTGDVPTGTLKAIEADMSPCFGKGWLTR